MVHVEKCFIVIVFNQVFFGENPDLYAKKGNDSFYPQVYWYILFIFYSMQMYTHFMLICWKKKKNVF